MKYVILRTTPLGPLKNLDLSEIQLPSLILAEMENVSFPENDKRQSDIGLILDSRGSKGYYSRISKNLAFSKFWEPS